MKSFFSLFLFLALAAPAVAGPKLPSVVVSIKPLHSLVSGIMQDVAEPSLLLATGGSPHGYNMRPSELRLLQQSDLIVWTGPELESFMTKFLDRLGTPEKNLTVLEDLPELEILPAREAGTWQASAADVHHDHGHGHGVDPHVWLSPANARVIAAAVANRLSAIDPDNRALYDRNLAELTRRLKRLEAGIEEQLSGLEERPYIVFHDAYQYFENAFGLRPVGALAIDPDRRPGARRLAELKQEIRKREIACVFTEPQFRPRLVSILTEDTSARPGVLDPLGARLDAGAELYFTLLQEMANSLQNCLADQN